MKVAAVQFKPVIGDLENNINRHVALIELAVQEGADLVYFPELSVTGYEAQLAKSFALELKDNDFGIFQNLSDTHGVTIGVGVPLLSGDQVQIGMIWFAADKPQASYKKQLLHSTELSFFVPGTEQLILHNGNDRLAPAICYESLRPEHADNAASMGTNVYLASVAESSTGLEGAMKHYSKIAKQHHMYVVLANCLGSCGNFMGTGHSASWDANGHLLAQMDGESEGILLVDTENRDTDIIRI
ncbi:carbon-nitrogen hydrolase family protein [Vibrio mangrovi]|uniref:Carbon-nitrogen hydrolase family protein n=1 Tax=Vibrio mangrovi TaxID=474394 RepID=A0A1Y6IWU9_9VIBR|nr:carbon-nitrogen hydrolase family protein [Vibrio mangrovi]MDW6005433.1 carbon-nitrogen hydrolase family protein [Vibrio mangrovi]SMS02127.1 Nitrilase [Vibrio mangrovi]